MNINKQLWVLSCLSVLFLINHIWLEISVFFYLILLVFIGTILFLFSISKSIVNPTSIKERVLNEQEDIFDNRLIIDAAHELHKFLEQEVNIIANEVKRTKTLIAEGTQGVSTSFNALQVLNDEQHNIIKNLIKSTAELDNLLDDLANNTKKSLDNEDKTNELLAMISRLKKVTSNVCDNANILAEIFVNNNNTVSVGVQSLQFEDLARQSLESLQTNMKNMYEINEVLQSFENCNKASVHHSMLALAKKSQEVHQNTKTFEIKRKVKQMSMDEGDIELF